MPANPSKAALLTLRKDGLRSLVRKGTGRVVFNHLLLPLSPRLAMWTRDQYRRGRGHLQRLRHRRTPDKFTDANPLKRISVDSTRIEYRLERDAPIDMDRPLGRVIDGQWDQMRIKITDRTFYRALESVYVDGEDWESTDYYRNVVDAIESGQRKWGCRSKSDLERKRAHVDRVYEALQSDGYRSQRDLVARGDERFPLHDPIVAIGRDGQIIHVRDGNHRIGLSKLLGLDSITVWIGPRHARWQRIRNAVAQMEPGDELPSFVQPFRSHPDLIDLVDKNHSARE